LLFLSHILRTLILSPSLKSFNKYGVNDISIDDNNNLWATTSHIGLLKITDLNKDNINIEVINKKDGIPDLKLKALDILNGELWIASQNKIFKYNISNKKFQLYPSVITDSELIFSEGALNIYGSNLYAGTSKGLVNLDINLIKLNNFKPNIHITKIKNGNKYISQLLDEKTAVFSYDNNNIYFQFSVTDYNNPSGNLIKYKLKGFDKDWVIEKNIDTASYTNLDAGEYTFIIYGSNSDGVWSENKAEFHFEIKQAWWFYALITMIFFLLYSLSMVFYSRHKQMKILEIRANFDSLTGIPNRFNFNLSINELVLQNNNSFAVVFIDLDDFKEVNDSMGHSIGG